ncbi:hypothetical protein [Herminiimonas sp. CN]|uniref:hypothetical protein n=1 Tax=Herminiimonas sp. CN TaxID=1349818 RepID=UPI0004735830|nr:hypothetical protein [Herminiimonas sp. CN]
MIFPLLNDVAHAAPNPARRMAQDGMKPLSMSKFDALLENIDTLKRSIRVADLAVCTLAYTVRR